jgi:hypothetical protein
MVALAGTYQNGVVKLDVDYPTENPVKVIVAFLEELPNQSVKKLSLSDFSFLKSQKKLKNFKGSFSNEVIEERRKEL